MEGKRWNCKKSDFIDNPKIDIFLNEIAEVCKKHRLQISHEDDQGAFEIVQPNEETLLWFLNAHDAT